MPGRIVRTVTHVLITGIKGWKFKRSSTKFPSLPKRDRDRFLPPFASCHLSLPSLRSFGSLQLLEGAACRRFPRFLTMGLDGPIDGDGGSLVPRQTQRLGEAKTGALCAGPFPRRAVLCGRHDRLVEFRFRKMGKSLDRGQANLAI